MPVILPYNGKKALFTWQCEGSPDPFAKVSNMFIPHVPSAGSGITICGFDFYQNRETLEADLVAAKLPSIPAQRVVKEFGHLRGDAAKAELERLENVIHIWSIVFRMSLFEIAYDRKVEDMNRIHTTKPDFVRKYGTMPALPQWVEDLVLDLLFRGDYTTQSREWLCPQMIAERWDWFATVIQNRKLWANVPEDRFQRRAEYAAGGLASMVATLPGLVVQDLRGHLEKALACLSG